MQLETEHGDVTLNSSSADKDSGSINLFLNLNLNVGGDLNLGGGSEGDSDEGPQDSIEIGGGNIDANIPEREGKLVGFNYTRKRLEKI